MTKDETVLEQLAYGIEDLDERLEWLRAEVVVQKQVMKKLQYLCKQTSNAMESFSGGANDKKVKGTTGKGRSYRFGKWYSDT